MTDTDNDQMDDVWETAFFGDLSRNGSQDFDRDGQNDLSEFIAQTDPTDRTSTLRILGASSDQGAQLLIKWDAVPGVSYTIESTSDFPTLT